MVFGDNVRARIAARALPRTPTQRRERKEGGRQDSNKNYTPITPPPFHNPQHNTTKQDKTCTVVTTRRHADSIRHPLPTTHYLHTAFLPNTNYHRHSPITQPCHKDTTLNQQRYDREHKRWEGEKESRAQFPHRTSPPTTNTTTQDRRETETIREGTEQRAGEQDNARCQTQSEHEATHNPPPSPFNRATG